MREIGILICSKFATENEQTITWLLKMKNAWLSLQNDMELMWLFLLLHRQISNVSRQGPELWC
jgi:hypothetical protein